MSLPEIQSLISQLPRSERETLLRLLGQQLADEAQGGRLPENSEAPKVERSQWLDELRQLRESVTTGTQGTPLSEILDDDELFDPDFAMGENPDTAPTLEEIRSGLSSIQGSIDSAIDELRGEF